MRLDAYDASNFSLVTGASVAQWDELSGNANDLTQPVALNQMELIESDIVTQYTASNQPKVDYDKIVTQDTLANQPTYDSAEGALVFDGVDDNLKHNVDFGSGDFTVEFILGTIGTSGVKIIYGTGLANLRVDSSNIIRLRSNESNFYVFNTTDAYSGKIVYKRTGNNLTVWHNDTQLETVNVTGDTFTFDSIGTDSSTTLDGNVYSIREFNQAVADPTNITETPDFTLDASNLATMRKADGSTPANGDQVAGWWDASAEKAMVFEEVSYMRNLVPSNDWTHYFKLNMFNDTQFLSHSNLPTRLKIFENGSFRLTSDSGLTLNITDAEAFNANSLKVSKNGGFITILIDDQEINGSPFDFTGESFSFDTLSDDSLNTNFHVYLYKQWNSADSSGTPDFTLDFSDKSTMRTSANEVPLLGEDVAKVYAEQHNKYENRVSSDSDSFMSPMPAQSGDFTYIWRVEHSALSTTDYVFSSSGTPSALVWLSDNYLYLRDTTGANDIGLNNHALEAGEHTYALVREGDDIRFYVDSILKQTVDVTGRTYTWDVLGDSADSLLALCEYFNIWSKALTQDEINYFSYLRDAQNKILQPPLLPNP